MPTRSESSRESSPDDVDQDRLAQLERLLADQLYSTSTLIAAPRPDPGPSAPAPAPAPAGDISVSFRLFSSQKAPTKVTIREQTPPPPSHAADPRIRAVEDEDPLIVKQRRRDIERVAVSGREIREQSNSLPVPHSPSYRLTRRVIPGVPHAAATSTREPLDLPRLAYLNAILPRALHNRSPATVPVANLDDAPREPNQGLIGQGPYAGGTKQRKRFPLALHRETRESKIRLDVVPVLPEEKVNAFVWRERERKRVAREHDKDKKKRLKAKMLRKKHGDDLKEGADSSSSTPAKKKRKGRLSKERRERAKKRASKRSVVDEL